MWPEFKRLLQQGFKPGVLHQKQSMCSKSFFLLKVDVGMSDDCERQRCAEALSIGGGRGAFGPFEQQL